MSNGASIPQAEDSTRAQLAVTIRRFLNSELTAFKFDDALDQFHDSPDHIVAFVAHQAWYFYDDCQDHFIAVNRHRWNDLQRLLLLLETDCRLEIQSSAAGWSTRQSFTLCGLLLFLGISCVTGFDWHLFWVSVAIGALATALSTQRLDPPAPEKKCAFPYAPFASFTDLRRARQASRFHRMRYPRELETRSIRSHLSNRANRIEIQIMRIIAFPLIAFLELLPDPPTTVVKAH